MTHGLQIGTLDLVDGFSDEGYELRVLADGASFGSPEAKVKQIVSALADGDLVSYDRAGNRVVEFSVQITAPDGVALAAGEAALRRELYRPNTVTWTPPSSFSPPTVFDVLTSEGQPSFSDLDEIRNKRIVKVTLTCAPHARSATLTTAEALATPTGTATVTLVDNGTSATGWTATRSGAAAIADDTSEPGSVGVFELDSLVTSPETWTLTRTGSVDLTATPYLVAEIRTVSYEQGMRVTASVPGMDGDLPILGSRRMDDGSGYFEVTFDARAHTTVPSLTFSHTSRAGEPWQGMFIRNISRTDAPPNETPRQMSRVIPIGGTERTPGSIHVSSENGIDPLELAIVHTCPEDGSGYSPPLRRWRVSASTGPETVMAAALSGQEEPIAFEAGGFYAEVPTSALPEGGYVLAARVRMNAADGGTGQIHWSTSTLFPDTTTQQGFTIGSADVALTDGEYAIVPVAVLSLPSVRTAAGKVQIVLQGSVTGNPQIYLDEAWLFRADDDCALTIVETARPHLWLDSPDITSPVPRVWVGDSVETRVHPGEGLHAQGAHVLSADGTTVFTAALTDWAAVDASFYRRYHSNAAT